MTVSQKVMAIGLAAVFLIGSLSGAGKYLRTQEAECVDKVDIDVTTSRDTAIQKVADGEKDILLQSLGMKNYADVSDDLKDKLGLWTGSGEYYNLLLNPAHEPDASTPDGESWKYVCQDDEDGNKMFNPFAVKKFRYAMNFLVNRKKIGSDIFEGYAEPRYFPVKTGTGPYEDYFEAIKEEHGITSTGNLQKAKEMIYNVLEKANDDMVEGDIRSPKDHHGDYWQYKPPGKAWKNMTVQGVFGNDFTEKKMEQYVENLLEDEIGIKVIPNPFDTTMGPPNVYSGEYDDPLDDYGWSYYIEGWHPYGNTYYPGGRAVERYCPSPSYGAMPNLVEGETHYQYENETLVRLGKSLYNGKINTVDEYWNKLTRLVEAGLDESIRVFLSTEKEYYVYNDDKVMGAATDVVTGWSDVFGPRTIRTNDGNLSATVFDIDLSEYRWNYIGGSEEGFSDRIRKMVRGVAGATHPQTGKPMGVRESWTVTKDYTWEEDGNLTKKIEVPSSAVVYKANQTDKRWEQVGTGKKSAVKVTYDVDLGRWHDGHEMTVRDIMAYYAFSKDMCYDLGEEGDYYNQLYAWQRKAFYDDIVATRWNQEENTFTIWGDYTFPAKSKIGEYFTVWPIQPYQIYEATEQLVIESDLVPEGSEPYAWDNYGEGNLVHYLSESQGSDIKTVLQNMKSADWMPPYLKKENNAPINISQAEFESQIDDIIGFYDEYHHLYDSNGPFKITDYNSTTHEMSMKRASGYPYPMDHWEEKLSIEKFTFSTDIQTSDEIVRGDDLTVEVGALIDADYPIDEDRDLPPGTEANITLSNMVTSEKAKRVTEPTIGNRSISTVIETEDMAPGTYRLTIEAKTPGGWTRSIEKTVKLLEPDKFLVKSLTVDGDNEQTQVNQFVNTTIKTRVLNTYKSDQTAKLEVDGSTIKEKTVKAGETENFSATYRFTTTGEHTVKVGNRSVVVSVVKGGLDITGLHLENEKIEKGRSVSISANIENGRSSPVKVKVLIKDETGEVVDSKLFTVDAGDTTSISWSRTFKEEGEYTVELGDQSQSLEVKEDIDREEEPDEDWMLMLGLTAVMGVIIAIVFSWVYREER